MKEEYANLVYTWYRRRLPKELRFVKSNLLAGKDPAHTATLELLTGYEAWEYLSKKDEDLGLRYLALNPDYATLSRLSEPELNRVREELPPIYELRLADREPTELEKEVKSKSNRQLRWKFRWSFTPFYLAALAGSSLASIPLYALGLTPLYALPEIATYLERKGKPGGKIINAIASAYYFLRSPLMAAETKLEYRFLGPKLARWRIGKKIWERSPRALRKLYHRGGLLLNGILPLREHVVDLFAHDGKRLRKKLSYEEVKRELLNALSELGESYAQDVKEEALSQLENELVEIENPAESLYRDDFISTRGYFKRKIVARRKGKKVEIVNRKYLKKLASKLGEFETRLEQKVERNPTHYLDVDVDRDGNVVYIANVIGVDPYFGEISKGFAAKEASGFLKWRKAQRILDEYAQL